MCIISESSKTSSYVDTPLLRKLSEERCHRLLILQCAVQEGLLVANGQTAGGIFVGSTAHDVAATKLIIEEAGGKTSDLFGNDQSYDTPVKGFVYSNGIVHNELLELVNDSLIKRVV
jgi:fructose-1,6-bisphosphatase/inositol monophosphatase family enzyme